MSRVRVLPCGPAAVLLEVDDAVAVTQLHQWLQMQRLPDVRSLVPAARTVLVEGAPSTLAALRTALATSASSPSLRMAPPPPRSQAELASQGPPVASTEPASPGAAGRAVTPGRGLDVQVGATVEIPVVYDGDDLTLVARLCGMSTEEVVRRHCAATYTAAFCGFAPGFTYLVGGDPSLQLPRRADPRPRVPAGSLAIGGEYTAVYPSGSPGGWHLLGRALVDVWRLDRVPPALITPGATVRFVP